MFTIYGGKAAFDQWDKGQRVQNPEMAAGDKVIFLNGCGETHPMKAYTYEGSVVCDVPNDLLRMARPMLIDLCGSMEHRTRLNVRPRAKPDDYVYEDNIKYPHGGGNTEEIERRLDELNEEIAELRDGETVTKTDVLVSFDAGEGDTIEVTSDTDQLTLLQHGKNFMPSGNDLGNIPTKTEYNITATTNSDGSITLNGAPNGPFGYWLMNTFLGSARKLPAGEYTLSVNLVSGANWIGFYLNATYDDGTKLKPVQAYSNTPVTFKLDRPATLDGYVQVSTNQTYNDCVMTVQLECGSAATDYEQFRMVKHSKSVPFTISAFEGTNVLFAENAEQTITAKHKKSEATNAIEKVKELLKFDPAPYGLPVLYLNGNTTGMTKDNAVTLSYVFGEASGELTCKWQGNSSLTFPKKNYTLKFDNAFEAVEGWGEQKKYCMKANHNDFTQSRNVVSAKIWGELVRTRTPANATLAACPNYGAIDGFPVVIVLNGEFNGVYCFNIPKDAWMMNMGSGTNEAILCADLHVPATKFEEGNAVLDGSDFKIEYITDKSDISWVLTSVNNLISACANSDGSDLDTTIAEMLDWESAIDYYIYSALLRHTDGISKNYLLSTYDGVKWFFTAYDMDTVFGNVWNGASFASPVIGGTFAEIAEENHLFHLIKTYKLDALKARYAELRKRVMSEANIAVMFTTYAGKISRALLDEEIRTWPTTPYTSVHTIDGILNWYRLRCEYIDAEIEAMQ